MCVHPLLCGWWSLQPNRCAGCVCKKQLESLGVFQMMVASPLYVRAAQLRMRNSMLASGWCVWLDGHLYHVLQQEHVSAALSWF